MKKFTYQWSAVAEDTEYYDNEMEIIFDAISKNEGFARIVVASFITQLNPTLEEVSDVKTAVSEAVTNAIIHGYSMEKKGSVVLHCTITGNEVIIEVTDYGKGIANIPLAMQPMYTEGSATERSGMGFAFMTAFMDDVKVTSEVGKGTTVRMRKRIGTT